MSNLARRASRSLGTMAVLCLFVTAAKCGRKSRASPLLTQKNWYYRTSKPPPWNIKAGRPFVSRRIAKRTKSPCCRVRTFRTARSRPISRSRQRYRPAFECRALLESPSGLGPMHPVTSSSTCVPGTPGPDDPAMRNHSVHSSGLAGAHADPSRHIEAG